MPRQYLARPPPGTQALIDAAVAAELFLVQETGPLAFVLAEGGGKKWRVRIGDPHHCSCRPAQGLCVHLLFTLIKIFRLPLASNLLWQRGLIDREVEQLVRSRDRLRLVLGRRTGPRRSASTGALASAAAPAADGSGVRGAGEPAASHARRKAIDDVCPICQDEMDGADGPAIVYCESSCGNNMHRKCMRVWARHRRTLKEDVTCPLCREPWAGDLEQATQQVARMQQRQEARRRLAEAREENARQVHLGFTCAGCRACPVRSRALFLCVVCTELALCEFCFRAGTHADHGFLVRESPDASWAEAPPRIAAALQAPAPSAGTSASPPAERVGTPPVSRETMDDLQHRELNDGDYETLLAMGERAAPARGVPAALLASLASQPASDVAALPDSCVVCLEPVAADEPVTALPCSHAFHTPCIVQWLGTRDACPVDGLPVFGEDAVRDARAAEAAAPPAAGPAPAPSNARRRLPRAGERQQRAGGRRSASASAVPRSRTRTLPPLAAGFAPGDRGYRPSVSDLHALQIGPASGSTAPPVARGVGRSRARPPQRRGLPPVASAAPPAPVAPIDDAFGLTITPVGPG